MTIKYIKTKVDLDHNNGMERITIRIISKKHRTSYIQQKNLSKQKVEG